MMYVSIYINVYIYFYEYIKTQRHTYDNNKIGIVINNETQYIEGALETFFIIMTTASP